MRELVAQARGGKVRAASRLISLLEDDPTLLPELFAGMGAWPEPRLVVGITGAPGVGKSTLVDALIAEWRKREPEKRVGVLAVDPSSPFTGGAVLGDRIRMMDHAVDEKVFIRSLASRGHLGGLTLGIKGAVRVMGLLGCDVVLIETVGVGQSEVEVAGVADMTVIVLSPGQGDGVQLLKAGLMEAGDVFVVNKADRPGAEKLVAELVATLGQRSEVRGLTSEVPPTDAPSDDCSHGHTYINTYETVGVGVFKVSAVEWTGVGELVGGIEGWAERRRGRIQERRAVGVREEVRQAILEAARRRVVGVMGHNGTAAGSIEGVLNGRMTVGGLAEELMRRAVGDE